MSINYGVGFSSNGVSNFKAGINEGVAMVKFEYVPHISTPKYEGECIDVEFEKDGSIHRERIFPLRDVKAKDGEPYQLTVENAVKEFNSYMKHIICNYVEDEVFMAGYASLAASGDMSFKTLAEFCISVLPADYPTRKGRLVLQYKNDGNLKAPDKMWVTGIWFDMKGRDIKLHKRLVLTPPAQAPKPQAGDNEVAFGDW